MSQKLNYDQNYHLKASIYIELVQCILKYGFFKKLFFLNEPLISCPFLSSKLDSPVIKILERHSLNVKKCLSNVLIKGKSNLDERNGQLIRGSSLKKQLPKESII